MLGLTGAACHAARFLRRTAATDTTAWLVELVAAESDVIDAWIEEADRACERARSAYERVRGNKASVVPSEVE